MHEGKIGESPVNENTPKTCLTPAVVEPLLEAIRQRFSQLTDDDCQRRVFLNRLRTIGVFDAEPFDYQEPDVAELPKELEIGFAVCHPECGNVVIEGGPQGCDRCGGTMLPVKTGSYRLKKMVG
jgi:hypothetical protein